MQYAVQCHANPHIRNACPCKKNSSNDDNDDEFYDNVFRGDHGDGGDREKDGDGIKEDNGSNDDNSGNDQIDDDDDENDRNNEASGAAPEGRHDSAHSQDVHDGDYTEDDEQSPEAGPAKGDSSEKAGGRKRKSSGIAEPTPKRTRAQAAEGLRCVYYLREDEDCDVDEGKAEPNNPLKQCLGRKGSPLQRCENFFHKNCHEPPGENYCAFCWVCYEGMRPSPKGIMLTKTNRPSLIQRRQT